MLIALSNARTGLPATTEEAAVVHKVYLPSSLTHTFVYFRYGHS